MHLEEPPYEAMQLWLGGWTAQNAGYGHLLLEQQDSTPADLSDRLVPYFESAHGDAREHFCDMAGIDLHPDADGNIDPDANLYPNCLSLKAKHGLFGEVMAGLVTEVYDFVGGHNWQVPIFLFRYHADAEKAFYDLTRPQGKPREIFGRFGSDFIGLSLNQNGSVNRIIIGEAKWRDALSPAVVKSLLLGPLKKKPKNGRRVRTGKGIWRSINLDSNPPHGLRQLQILLKQRAANQYGPAIASLGQALLSKNAQPLPRTNLILIAGAPHAGRNPGERYISATTKSKEYVVGHDLQIVELVLPDGPKLIDDIYNAMWQ